MVLRQENMDMIKKVFKSSMEMTMRRFTDEDFRMGSFLHLTVVISPYPNLQPGSVQMAINKDTLKTKLIRRVKRG